MDGQLAEPVMRLVQHAGDVQRGLIPGKGTVALNVACHAVDDVRQGLTGVGIVRVVVHNRLLVDGAVAPHLAGGQIAQADAEPERGMARDAAAHADFEVVGMRAENKEINRHVE